MVNSQNAAWNGLGLENLFFIYIGKFNEISEEPELKVEVTIKSQNLETTIAAIKAVHPYEEPTINILPLLMI